MGSSSAKNRSPWIFGLDGVGFPDCGAHPSAPLRRSPTRTPPPPNLRDYCPMDHLLFGATPSLEDPSSTIRRQPGASEIGAVTTARVNEQQFSPSSPMFVKAWSETYMIVQAAEHLETP
jgi:hypothetical protein